MSTEAARYVDMKEQAERNFAQRLKRRTNPGGIIIFGRGEDGSAMVSYTLMAPRGSELEAVTLDMRGNAVQAQVDQRPNTVMQPIRSVQGFGLVVSNLGLSEILVRKLGMGASLIDAIRDESYGPEDLKRPRITGVVHAVNDYDPRYELAVVLENPGKPGQTVIREYAYRNNEVRNGIGICVAENDQLDPTLQDPFYVPLGREDSDVTFSMATGLDAGMFVASATASLDYRDNRYSFALAYSQYLETV